MRACVNLRERAAQLPMKYIYGKGVGTTQANDGPVEQWGEQLLRPPKARIATKQRKGSEGKDTCLSQSE